MLALAGVGSKEVEGRLSDRASGIGLPKFAPDPGDEILGDGALGGGGESEGVGGVGDLEGREPFETRTTSP